MVTKQRLSFFLGLYLVQMVGCTPHLIRMQTPDTEDIVKAGEPREDSVKLVGDLTSPWNTSILRLESVALITGLNGTGSDPMPSAQRQALIDEMQTHEVDNPNQILASPNTSLAICQAYLPPGVQKGDPIDVVVRVRQRSETSSLRGGWLMRTRLRETALLQNLIRTGKVGALAEGPVLVDSVFEGDDDPVRETRGRVIGGGVATMTRPMGLTVNTGNHSVRTAALIGNALNARFHTFDKGIKQGIANPTRDNFVELTLHPSYKYNVSRFIRVVQNVPVIRPGTDQTSRIDLLRLKLLEPTTAELAAIQLEAIGKDSEVILREGLEAADPEIRFYAAEALAYLDIADAADVLAVTAQNEYSFRWRALTALAAMNHVSAYDALSDLVHADSAETRYGAFRALRYRNHHDPLVQGEVLGETFCYHQVPTTSEPMIHFARSRRPEVVVFGNDVRVNMQGFVFAGKQIVVKGLDDGRVKVSRFTPGQDDQVEICSPKLDELIRAIVKLGGGYADVLEAVRTAKAREYIDARVVIDAVPRPGREYFRDEFDENIAAGDEANEEEPVSTVAARTAFSDSLGDQPKAETATATDDVIPDFN